MPVSQMTQRLRDVDVRMKGKALKNVAKVAAETRLGSV